MAEKSQTSYWTEVLTTRLPFSYSVAGNCPENPWREIPESMAREIADELKRLERHNTELQRRVTELEATLPRTAHGLAIGFGDQLWYTDAADGKLCSIIVQSLDSLHAWGLASSEAPDGKDTQSPVVVETKHLYSTRKAAEAAMKDKSQTTQR